MAGIPYAPRGAFMLPLDLLRQENVSAWPDRVAQAREVWLATMSGGPPPVLMPHSVGYQAWKTTNDGFQVQSGYQTPLQDPLSVLQALHAKREALKAPYPYPLEAAAADKGGNVFPPIKQLDETEYVTRIRPIQQPILPPEDAWKDADQIASARKRAAFYQCQEGLRRQRLAQEQAVGLLMTGHYESTTVDSAAEAQTGLGSPYRPGVERLRRHAIEHRAMQKMGLAGRGRR